MTNTIPNSSSSSSKIGRAKHKKPSSSILHNRLNVLLKLRRVVFLLPFVVIVLVAVSQLVYASTTTTTNAMKLPTFLLSHYNPATTTSAVRNFRTPHPCHRSSSTFLKTRRSTISSSSLVWTSQQSSVLHQHRQNSCYGNHDNHHEGSNRMTTSGSVVPTRCYWSTNNHPTSNINPLHIIGTSTTRSRSSRSNIRLFGSKRIPPPNDDKNNPSPSPPPGEIYIYDEQTKLPQINIPKLKRTITILREILTYPTYDITLILTDDEEMRQTNLDTRVRTNELEFFRSTV